MAVANPREVPEYELNPLELQVRKSDGITKVVPFLPILILFLLAYQNNHEYVCFSRYH